MKHKELIGKSVRLSSVFQWYTNNQGHDYAPSVSSSLRLPPINNDNMDIHGQKEAEEHGGEHGLADEEVRDGPPRKHTTYMAIADKEEVIFEEDDNENYNGAV